MGYILWPIFFISAVLLCFIILLQEGKGGGLAEAFGGMGAETFGVKAAGANRATALLALLFVGSAIFINKCATTQSSISLPAAPSDVPDPGSAAGAAPAGDAGSGDEGK